MSRLNRTVSFILLVLVCSCVDGRAPREVSDFNFDWSFSLGERPGDGGWREVHLPHDWSIEGSFDRKNPSSPLGGALPGGIGWYRKAFPTPAGVEDGRRVMLEFDGVFMNSTVLVNGDTLGFRPYGYSSFSYDITGSLKSDGTPNEVLVCCDNSREPNSRWYSGCGIYRDVRLVTVSPVHVAYQGSFVTTPSVTSEMAAVAVSLDIENSSADTDAVVTNSIVDASGKTICSVSRSVNLSSGVNVVRDSLELASPVLWDTDSPYLYTMTTEISVGGETVDIYPTSFGVRTADWDVEKGFVLNGRPVKLKGVCLHHDLGCLGSAAYSRAIQRQLQIMKAMGANAIRTSHNPPSPILLTLCDEMGLLVMDEAFDIWRSGKSPFDYSIYFDEWCDRDLSDFVKRDRNHPSIIMWSIGNEIHEQKGPVENIELTRHLAGIVRESDPTRAITSGCHEIFPENNLLASGALDVYGFNYHPGMYDTIREWFPDKPLIGSETISSINSRGVYYQPSTSREKPDTRVLARAHRHDHQLTAYDASCVPWGDFHEAGWIAVRDRDWMAGTFVWTGFDYIGEPTPFNWPSRSSYFGIVDLAGFPKDPYYMYRSEWTDDTFLHLFPHWNWNEGDEIDVWAYYGNADEVELFVNGKSLGRKSKTDDVLHAEWLSVPYEPGKIEAVSYASGKEVARSERVTAGPAAALRLTPDRRTIKADGYDLSFITVELVDKAGNALPAATDMLHFEASGSCELFGVDNGDATDHLSLKGHDKALFSGKAIAVLRSIKGDTGNGVLTVSCPELGIEKKVKVRTVSR